MPDTKEHIHQLIVIGNGFDLACGLHSSYAHFFGNLEADVFPDRSALSSANWGTYLRDRGFTAWDVTLCHHHLRDCWYMVEECIGEWIRSNKGIGFDHIGKIEAVLTGNGQNVGDIQALSEDWRTYTGAPCESFPELDVARFLQDVNPGVASTAWNRDKVRDALLDELHRLERRFADYLTDEVGSRDCYVPLACTLLSELKAGATRPDSFDYDSDVDYDTSILSFNYTMPWGYGNILGSGDEAVCIHGCLLDGDIVFGTDGTDCMEDLCVLPFTKTYRVMGLGIGDVADVVHSCADGHDQATALIKFFGHSLSNADYAYFQSLFDAVDLYGGKTTLIFYYRPHGEGDPEVVAANERDNMMHKVTKLLVTYGKTLDNKDHGRNLIHKLLLEGRLHVREI